MLHVSLNTTNFIEDTKLSKRTSRWKFSLSEYSLSLKHLNGKLDGAADYLYFNSPIEVAV